MRSAFIFTRNIYEAIKTLPDEQFAIIMDAICEYCLNDNDISDSLNGITQSMFILMRPKLDNHLSEYDRRSPEMANWRKAVFKRDNHICQRCKCDGKSLEAHHIKPFAQYPKLRFVVSNGISLCGKCHKEIHKEMRANG